MRRQDAIVLTLVTDVNVWELGDLDYNFYKGRIDGQEYVHTFATAPGDELAVGDYVCLEGELLFVADEEYDPRSMTEKRILLIYA